ncbi:MAG: cysteine--tRNA ligase, partial [Aestuariivirga sp.]
WDSPWGRGRPGWHIECSEMSRKYLGQVFDIHGGGLDLIFPHHENELAQSRCAFGTSVMANVWMHNGFLQVEGQKMSKSLGNFYTISELLDTSNFGGRKWPGEVLRLAMLLSHYREPIDFSFSRLLEAERMLARFKEIAAGRIDRRLDRSLHDQFHLQLSDDLNTPMALRVLDQASADLSPRTAYTLYCCLKFLGFSGNRTKLATTSDKLTSVVKAVSQMTAGDFNRLMASAVRHTHFPSGRLKPEAEILDNLYKIYQLVNEHGTFFQNWAQNDANLRHYRFVFSVDPRESEIDELVALRLESRKAKNWAESDRIRDELAAMGIAIKDNKDGTTSWEVKR